MSYPLRGPSASRPSTAQVTAVGVIYQNDISLRDTGQAQPDEHEARRDDEPVSVRCGLLQEDERRDGSHPADAHPPEAEERDHQPRRRAGTVEPVAQTVLRTAPLEEAPLGRRELVDAAGDRRPGAERHP